MIRWSEAAATVLNDYLLREQREKELMATLPVEDRIGFRDQFLLQVGELSGEYLHGLVASKPGARVLELGTSYGYSTLYLAHAAYQVKSKVITVELDADKQTYAREQLTRAGLSDVVEWVNDDVLNAIDNLQEDVDIVLIDVWKELYPACIKGLASKLNPAAVVVADNVIFPPHSQEDIDHYRSALYQLPNLKSSVELDIGSGLEVSTF
jgi:predicted O-methyltransferase YrrM